MMKAKLVKVKVVVRIEHWSVVDIDNNPYMAPERRIKGLHGVVYGHPKFPEGEIVTTSKIVSIQNGMVCTASGTAYQLGEVDPDYEVEYPNALDRILGKPSDMTRLGAL